MGEIRALDYTNIYDILLLFFFGVPGVIMQALGFAKGRGRRDLNK